MTWNRDDLASGLAFLAIGGFFAANTLLSLEVGTAAEMGPGYFPLALCVILVLLGGAILFNARDKAGELAAPSNLRAIALITIAPVAFGLTLRSLGLVPALVISIALAVAASRMIGLARATAIVAGMTAFCIGVFYYGLQVPVDLLNPALLN